MTKEECLKALCRIQCGAKANKDCKDCECYDTEINIWKCVENTKESLVIKQLINEHFDNSLDFKAFKLPGDSTLRANTKEILISYIHALYQNWGKSDRWFERSVENNEILLKENKELQEAYKELQDSYDELLATSVKLQEGICTCCEYANPPLKFEELRKYIGQPIWDNKERKYRLIKSISYCGYWIKFVHTIDSTIGEGYEEDRFYRYEVKE